MLNVTPESHRRSDSPQPNREDLDCVVEVHNLTLAPAPSKVAPAESIEPLQHLSRRIARLQRGAEEPDPDIAGRIAPVPPVAENLWRLRNAIDQFVTESLRAPSKFDLRQNRLKRLTQRYSKRSWKKQLSVLCS